MNQQKREQVVVHVERVEQAPEAVAATHRARRSERETEEDWLSMRMLGEDRARLKRIVSHMLGAGDLQDNESIGYAGAARYAFRRLTESLGKAD
ncbi:MAG: hypothetical protein RL685_5161 [Pseudomonadota bacterium]